MRWDFLSVEERGSMSCREGSSLCSELSECSSGFAMILRIVVCISEASFEIETGFTKAVRIWRRVVAKDWLNQR